MLYVFALTLTMLAIAAAQSAGNICDVCECLPGKAAQAQSVTCGCKSQNQNITTTRANMKGLDHIKTFSASNCNSLIFHQNSFADAHDLETVTVSRVQLVVYPSGVFAALSTLKIEDVEELRLEERAFMGADGVLSEVVIRRSRLEELPMHSLYGAHGVRRFELTDVVIKNIRSNAINIEMDKEASLFIVENCKVENIANKAIVLTTNKLKIANSDFDKVSSKAVNVTALTKVEINSTRFGAGCHEDGLLVSSNNILVINSTFNVLPIGLLTTLDGASSKVTFSSNSIKNFTLTGVNWNRIDFYSNDVDCDCELSKAAVSLKSLIDYNIDNLYKYNYCAAECSKKISLNVLVEEHSQICNDPDVENNKDLNFLCNITLPTTEMTTEVSEETNTTVEVPSQSSGISGRAGRAEDIEVKDAVGSTTDSQGVKDQPKSHSVVAGPHKSSASRNTGLAVVMGTLLFVLNCIG